MRRRKKLMQRRKYPINQLDEIQSLVISIYNCRKNNHIKKANLLDEKLARLQKNAKQTNQWKI